MATSSSTAAKQKGELLLTDGYFVGNFFSFLVSSRNERFVQKDDKKYNELFHGHTSFYAMEGFTNHSAVGKAINTMNT